MDEAVCSECSTRRSTTVNPDVTMHATMVESSGRGYDVFLNFRGEDTRKNIVDNLYLSLTEAEPEINVFMDEPSLPFGEEIDRKLLAAIERSKIAITIISEDYASSAFCLKELEHILRCKETRGLKVMPIFYKINPSDLRCLRNSFERIQTHIIKYDGHVVQSWKDALICIGNMKGLVVDHTSYEGSIVRKIIDDVKIMLKNPHKMNFNPRPERMEDMDHMVGVDEKAREIIELISENTNDVQIVGICGMGGIGKTTLARHIYNQLSYSYDLSKFIIDIQETSLWEVSVEQIVSSILEQRINSSSKGMYRIKQLLRNKKVLLVLDNIDSRIKMRTLMTIRSFFGSGSTIILTTRNLGVIRAAGVTLIYQLGPLDFPQSMELFCKYAFGRLNPPDAFKAYSNRVVEICGGLPLALEVLGSYLFCKEEAEWEHSLKKLEKDQIEHVGNILLIPYQTLDDKQKQIFLDIACFSNGFSKNSLLSALEDADVEALDKLEALSLVKFNNENKLYMHDLLRDLAREILQDEGGAESGYGSWFWMGESRHVLKGNKEVFQSTPSIEEAAATPTTLLDKQGYFPELKLQSERVQTTAIAKGKEPMVALEEPWISRHEFGESSNARKLQKGKPEVPLLFRIENTSTIRCNSMEADTCLSQPIPCLDRLFGEMNSVANRRCPLEKKLPYSTQEAISLVDSFIDQISLPNVAEVKFTSPRFLQLLESLRQPNALNEVPTGLVMDFHSALTSFADSPKYLDEIRSAKITFSKCTGDQMAKVDEFQKLKFKLDMHKNALQKTQRKVALLEDKLTSLKAKVRDSETKLTNAIPTVQALLNELKTCTDKLVEAQKRFDIIPILEKDIKSNHHRVLQLLHEIKSSLERKRVIRYLTFVSRSNYCIVVVILVGLFVSFFFSLHFQKDI